MDVRGLPCIERRTSTKMRIPDRLINNVHYKREAKTGCFIWLGRFSDGYPIGTGNFNWLTNVKHNWKTVRVHRYLLARKLKVNYQDINYHAHHECRNTRCINISHLKWIDSIQHKKLHTKPKKVLISREEYRDYISRMFKPSCQNN